MSVKKKRQIETADKGYAGDPAKEEMEERGYIPRVRQRREGGEENDSWLQATILDGQSLGKVNTERHNFAVEDRPVIH